MSTSQASSGGISVASLLGLIFITLKLTHYIDWSWWWVTAPFWIPFAIIIAILLIIVIILGIAAICIKT